MPRKRKTAPSTTNIHLKPITLTIDPAVIEKLDNDPEEVIHRFSDFLSECTNERYDPGSLQEAFTKYKMEILNG